jgi:hypothetical protein
MAIFKKNKNKTPQSLDNVDTRIIALSGEEGTTTTTTTAEPTTTTTTTAEPTTTTTTIDPLDQEVIPGVTLRQYWSADEYDGRR